MRRHIQQMRSEKDAKILMRLDSEMHDLINKATKNEMLVKMLGSLRDQSVRIWTFSPSGDEYLANMADEFEELVEALERRDEEASARILEQHSKGFIEHIRSQFSL
jgi:DNA-binding FadR family transcriptional regulator